MNDPIVNQQSKSTFLLQLVLKKRKKLEVIFWCDTYNSI